MCLQRPLPSHRARRMRLLLCIVESAGLFLRRTHLRRPAFLSRCTSRVWHLCRIRYCDPISIQWNRPSRWVHVGPIDSNRLHATVRVRRFWFREMDYGRNLEWMSIDSCRSSGKTKFRWSYQWYCLARLPTIGTVFPSSSGRVFAVESADCVSTFRYRWGFRSIYSNAIRVEVFSLHSTDPTDLQYEKRWAIAKNCIWITCSVFRLR